MDEEEQRKKERRRADRDGGKGEFYCLIVVVYLCWIMVLGGVVRLEETKGAL